VRYHIRPVNEIPPCTNWVRWDDLRDAKILIAEVGDECVGVIAYRGMRVCALGVRPDCRRQGIASALYHEMALDIGIPVHMWPQSGNLTPDGRALRLALGMQL
jgi:GNAT superfamily N-acetyltransferase